MKNFNNINEILDFAIEREQRAVDLYTILSVDSANHEMKEVFFEFAKEEMNHKALLIKVKEEGTGTFEKMEITDMKIADYIVPENKPHEELTYPEALKLAMWREKAAYNLYKKLASIVNDVSFKNLFESLANEELKHKNRFEKEYDDYVLREN